MKQEFAIAIPKGIDIEELVKNNPNSLYGDYLKYLIGSVVNQMGKYVDEGEINKREESNKVKLKDRYFKVNSLYNGGSYKKHKQNSDFLCGNNYEVKRSRTTKRKVNVLDSDFYIVGEKSIMYRLSKSYFREKPLQVVYITDRKIITSLMENDSEVASIVKDGSYKFLFKFFDSNKLKVDIDEAISLCEARYKVHKSYSKYVKEFTQLLNLYNGVYRISYKLDSINRLYSNITQLPKVYRKYVTYDNKQLVEVDISNSIIYFLGILLRDITNSNILINKDKGINYHQLLMISKTFETLSTKEIELIFNLGVNGGFYDEFVPEFEKQFTFEELKYHYEREYEDEYIDTEDQKRKVAKKLIFAMLFAESNHYENVQEVFKTKFPQFLELLNAFKQENDYREFSHILFKIEAYYVINVVARKFNNSHWRKAPVFTLHDCLITTIDFQKELEYCFKEEMTNLLGTPPLTKTKKW